MPDTRKFLMNLRKYNGLILSLSLFFVVLPLSLTHEIHCNHHLIEQDPAFHLDQVPINHKVNLKSGARRLASDYENIRVHIDTTGIETSTEITESLRSFLLDRIVPDAKAWVERTVKVIPVEGNLVLNNKRCYKADFPASTTTTGITNTDLAIVATATDDGQQASAWGTACKQDSVTHRPIAGQINFLPNSVEQDYDLMLAVTIHEITHVLVFSTNLMDDFIDPQTNERLGIDTFVKDSVVNGRTRSQITLPTVVAKARQHFCCDSLTGVELENQGEPSSRGNHWETKIIFNDFMAPAVTSWTQYSEITLALFVDSGWYDVNYSEAHTFLYGKCQGCSFVDGYCLKAGNPPTSNFPEYFCTENKAEICNFNRTQRGFCILESQSDIPAYWQYWSDDPKKSGSTNFGDHCPIMTGLVASDSPDCTMPSKYIEGSDSAFYYAGRADTRGKFSRCFVGNFYNAEYTSRYSHSFWTGNGDKNSCLPVDCRKDNLYVIIGDVEVKCPQAGGKIDLESYANLAGSIICPEYEALCPLYDLVGDIVDAGQDSDDNSTCQEDSGKLLENYSSTISVDSRLNFQGTRALAEYTITTPNLNAREYSFSLSMGDDNKAVAAYKRRNAGSDQTILDLLFSNFDMTTCTKSCTSDNQIVYSCAMELKVTHCSSTTLQVSHKFTSHWKFTSDDKVPLQLTSSSSSDLCTTDDTTFSKPTSTYKPTDLSLSDALDMSFTISNFDTTGDVFTIDVFRQVGDNGNVYSYDVKKLETAVDDQGVVTLRFSSKILSSFTAFVQGSHAKGTKTARILAADDPQVYSTFYYEVTTSDDDDSDFPLTNMIIYAAIGVVLIVVAVCVLRKCCCKKKSRSGGAREGQA